MKLEWYRMSDSVWMASALIETVSLHINKVSDNSYTLLAETLDGRSVLKRDIESFAMATREAEIYLYRRKNK